MTSGESATVLVVDDEPDVADAYAAQLEGRYTVEKAYGGQEALDEITPAVDVVLLDRRMPGVSGDKVLEKLRERDFTCRVAMVTAVDPDFDIIKMGFDDYVIKPVSREDLYATIDRLLTTADYETQIQEFYSLSAKKATLDANKPQAELARSEEFERLEDRIVELRGDLAETVANFDDQDFEAVFRDFGGQAAGAVEE